MASSKHEKQLARMRAERQAARRVAEVARRKRRRTVLAGVLSVLVVVAVVTLLAVKLRGDDKSTAADPAASAPTTPSASAAPAAATNGCTYKPGERPAKPVTAPTAADVLRTGAATATLKTSQGDVVLRFDNAKAPCTVGSFRSLVRQKYFDGTSCHRLTTAGLYVLQCGDPTGTGSGGPGYAFADENLPGAKYPRGTLAMANSGPGTNGSQFFLVYKDTQLPPSYSPFGTITGGLDVLDKIAAGGSTPTGDGKPKLPVTITAATLAPAA